MKFPDKPTCHKVPNVFKVPEIRWRDPNEQVPWRTCSYCGSIHPEDLIKIAGDGTVKSGEIADWKYGWPHKLYVYSDKPGFWCKFYNEHIADEGFDEEARAKLIEVVSKLGSIIFDVDPEKGLGYRRA